MYLAEGFVDKSGTISTWSGKMDEMTTKEYDKNVKYLISRSANQTRLSWR